MLLNVSKLNKRTSPLFYSKAILDLEKKNEHIKAEQPDIKDEYYLGEQFETYSRRDGFSVTTGRTQPTATSGVHDEIYDDNLGNTTIYSSQSSTIYSDEVNSLHDGMNYELLLRDNQSEAGSDATLVDDEPQVQEGNLKNFTI